ncbi:DMT family transporter [Phaeobacter gallaeciensis]|uniref:S-adenosylmethionine uptake transporter-like protein n=1 Tax=Phaeobacter gallaeciensis TaxID=60890 RepID=A0AAD0EBG9_9RHOB|nr:DMT family transporter [Phaeobacter gallaeciensis]AHD09693.1 putative permease [Phaeobacter gallaeciensis DSM 26640]ATE92957.1 S-adenosylmethionine uptake transporter-like protein [Phaeobacter gallaeciensis]ATE97221.1 S-adenosylmethionine uptake transporter-like protein [Phaeobacter gallaeciensis]ATF01622.1 S-adenosylmethionine uptake transporter-like protein [Phaeobacter gallaeciensis]ATF06002.1 S-adenosylmethionine uptake transporter-like protein [Phaeobacter gallaeciensis]
MGQNDQRIGTAAIWMIGAIVSFSSMAIAGREAGLSLDTFEIMTYRSAVGLVIVVVVLTATGSWRQVRRDRLGLHIIRNAAHFTGQNLWFFAVTLIPLAQVFALEFTSPLWVLMLSPLLLGEALTKPRVLAAALGFIGILIVARPSPETLNLGVIAAASSAVFFALTIMFTKRLTRHEPISSILLWLTLMQLAMGLAISGWDGAIAIPNAATALWLLVIGCAGLAAHFCVTKALAIAPATVVVPIDFARLPTIAVAGMLIYGEALNLWILLGAVVIFCANYINILDAAGRLRAHSEHGRSA